MITGFNTDIEHEGRTYHVQTEDKGTATPLVLTLVYDRGTILASKRSPYDDLLTGEFDETILTERLKKQHKLMCGAIRAGRIEDLMRMTMKESASRKQGLIAQKEVKSTVVTEPRIEDIPMPSILNGKSQVFKSNQNEEITFGGAVWDVPLEIVEEPAAEFVEIVQEMILPAEAVEIMTDLVKNDPTDDRLKIELIGEEKFKGGERKTVNISVRRGNQEKGLGGVQILVKIIGSSFRPLIFHARTDNSGLAVVHLQFPHFRVGRAAVLIKVMSEGEEAELRRVILHE